MRRIFGGQKKPEAPKPTLAEAADSAGKRDQVLGAKIKELDKQLAEFKVQLKTARPGPAQNRIKQRAMQVLKQKRMYESQQDQIRGMVSNMEQVKFASENVQGAIYHAQAFKASAQELKNHMKQIDIAELENDMDDMSELLEDTNEINEILSRSYAVDEDIDEDELEGELAALDELALESEDTDVPEYLKDDPVPAQPAQPARQPAQPAQPAQPGRPVPAQPAAAQQLDEFGLPVYA